MPGLLREKESADKNNAAVAKRDSLCAPREPAALRRWLGPLDPDARIMPLTRCFPDLSRA